MFMKSASITACEQKIKLPVTCDTTAKVCSYQAGHSCHVHSMTYTPAVVFMP